MLEQQFCNAALTTPRTNVILQVSLGFSYTWSLGAACGTKATSIMLGGAPLSVAATYRVTVNSFLADGGDGFPVLKDGTNRMGGAVDTDAFEAYFAANSPVAPGPQNRITRIP